jgi:tetratricopeptide (TPR) repeat protein
MYDLKAFRLAAASALFALGASSGAAELCKQHKLQTLPAMHPECPFYTGTAKYREKDYAAARTQWQALIDLKSVPREDEHPRIDAYNNLGFLYYTGRGVPRNHTRAIEYWGYAVIAGHEEAAYHLCHTYGKVDEPEYDPQRALGYCREAVRRYGQLKEQDQGTAEVIAQLKTYIERLEAR